MLLCERWGILDSCPLVERTINTVTTIFYASDRRRGWTGMRKCGLDHFLPLDGRASACGILQVKFRTIYIQHADHHPYKRARQPTRDGRFERWLSALVGQARA